MKGALEGHATGSSYRCFPPRHNHRLRRTEKRLGLRHDHRSSLRGNEEDGTIDVQALKQMTGLSRKYAVPFLELRDQL
ncbi:SelB domain-containing protein [Paraliomyxa miuraensis]|uniref:SelB domain-containing protein n=1 Tax=Paraliomyxa miuraensis TaxID=376150 RepID=UPI00389ACC2A